MIAPADLLADLVAANRILAHHDVVDTFGHVSVRHPDRPGHFLLARSRSPEQVEVADILLFGPDGEAVDRQGRTVYGERFIHAGVYEARADVGAVIHSHAIAVIPFSVTGVPLRPIAHVAGPIGDQPPVWDSADEFGDTDLLVRSMAMGRALARALGDRPAALMRGHGSVVAGKALREAVFTAIYLQINAELLWRALSMGEVNYLSRGEVEKAAALNLSALALDRAWENWRRQALGGAA